MYPVVEGPYVGGFTDNSVHETAVLRVEWAMSFLEADNSMLSWFRSRDQNPLEKSGELRAVPFRPPNTYSLLLYTAVICCCRGIGRAMPRS